MIPTVAMPRHRALDWPVASRAACAARLAEVSVTITEASDARELAGRPRLSESTPEQRWYCAHWFRGETGRRYLERARELRALYTAALAEADRETVAHARHLLRLRRSTPSTLRLCELQALVSQVRVLEHLAAERAPVALAA